MPSGTLFDQYEDVLHFAHPLAIVPVAHLTMGGQQILLFLLVESSFGCISERKFGQMRVLVSVCCVQEEAQAGPEGQPALMDPIADLKLNQLDIAEAVRERQHLLQV